MSLFRILWYSYEIAGIAGIASIFSYEAGSLSDRLIIAGMSITTYLIGRAGNDDLSRKALLNSDYGKSNRDLKHSGLELK